MKFAFSLLLLLSVLALYGQEAQYVCPPCNSSCDEAVHPSPGTCDHCGMNLITLEEREAMTVLDDMRIAFYLQDGVEILDFAGPMEVFAYAGFEVFTVSKTKAPIVSQGILTILPDYSIEDAPEADILAFFGGNSNVASEDAAVVNWVKQQEVDYHFSVCTGAFVLAEADILNGHTATTFHRALDGLEQNYPEVNVLRNVRFVDNGELITTAGISAGIDGALHLVAKLKGLTLARRTAYNMEYDKWVPGEGLILTEDNPYTSLELELAAEDYLGEYQHAEDRVFVHYSEREKALYGQVREQKYPVTYLGNDRFENTNGEQFEFQRSATGEVIGYEISGVFYRKL